MKEIHDKKPHSTNRRRMRAMLIFNPSARATRGSPIELVDVIHEMQAWKLPKLSSSRRRQSPMNSRRSFGNYAL